MKQWYRTGPAKFILWLLTVLCLAAAAMGGLATLYMEGMGYYDTPYDALYENAGERWKNEKACEIACYVLESSPENTQLYGMRWLSSNDLTYARIIDQGKKGALVWQEGEAGTLTDGKHPTYTLTYDCGPVMELDAEGEETATPRCIGPYQVTVAFNSYNLSYLNEATQRLNLLWPLRYAVLWVAGVGALVGLLALGLLCAVSGRRPGLEGFFPGLFTGIPYDLFLLLILTLGGISLGGLNDPFLHGDVIVSLSALGMLTAALAALGTIWLTDTVIRRRMGGIWRSALTVRMVVFVARAVVSIPTVPLAAGAIVIVCLGEALGLLLLWNHYDILLLWCAEKVVLVPLLLWIVSGFHRLSITAAALANGDLEAKADPAHLPRPLKAHAETLNRIAHSTELAVQEQLKSERFKTELITNVSHDIKTPLTSIINYTDLIGRETCDNEKIMEYAGVLHRQGERLKKLLEDLMQASKAATGNLETNPVPCQLGVMLDQAAGEYAHRLAECGLELVMQKPEAEVSILADGRHLWRVFDNLMNNICKYAQSGTRVYLSLTQQEEQAVVTFRNISRSPLNATADQFLERFSRGDTSRTTEGSGLGLSIAQSLTELQGGGMALTTDGDLFKVVLTFPVLGGSAQ